MKRSIQPRERKLNKFTLIELLTVILIITILASLLLPALQQTRKTAYRTTCMNRIRQIGLASINYSNAYNDWFVPGSTLYGNLTGIPDQAWFRTLGNGGYGIHPYGNDVPDYMCPELPWKCRWTGSDSIRTHIGLNARLINENGGHTLMSLRKPSEVLLGSDIQPGGADFLPSGSNENVGSLADYSSGTGNGYIHFRHQNSANVLYTDGHVQARRWAEMYNVPVDSYNSGVSYASYARLKVFIYGYKY